MKAWLKSVHPLIWTRLAMIGAAAVCLFLAYLAGPSWPGMADAFLAGVNVVGAIYNVFQLRMQRQLDEVSMLFDSMVQLNGQLIAGKVEMFLHGNEDSPPVQPKLH